MNKTKIGLAVAAAGIGLALAGGTAHADTAEFLEHVHALGFKDNAKTNTALSNAGTKMCDALKSGVSLDLVSAVTRNGLIAKGFNASDSDRFVAYVLTDLC